MKYSMKPLSCDPQRIKGMSERLIISHYENNYGGAVKRLNAISEQLAALDFANAPVFLINGLKREELVAISAASTVGGRNSRPWGGHRPAVPDGCSSPSARATGGS